MSLALRTKRLMREHRHMTADPPPLVQLQSHENLDKWEVAIQGATETLYAGEHYLLRFRFPEAYPLEAAEVVFVGNVPVHPHVYSNGHICLSILYQHWSPVLTVESVCLSILSMLDGGVWVSIGDVNFVD
ncbi:hypothetical protein IWW57_002143 [Coemansia sp. S610]|nr:hypothetical protein IWW57_002143 [Coemansia sp. S610]